MNNIMLTGKAPEQLPDFSVDKINQLLGLAHEQNIDNNQTQQPEPEIQADVPPEPNNTTAEAEPNQEDNSSNPNTPVDASLYASTNTQLQQEEFYKVDEPTIPAVQDLPPEQ